MTTDRLRKAADRLDALDIAYDAAALDRAQPATAALLRAVADDAVTPGAAVLARVYPAALALADAILGGTDE